MGFSSADATNARVIRRTRREIFLRFFFFAVRLPAAFFFADLAWFWLGVEACGNSGAAAPRDMEPLTKKSETASTGTHVFTVECSLARESLAQKRTIVVSEIPEDFQVEVTVRARRRAAVTFLIGGAAFVNFIFQAFV